MDDVWTETAAWVQALGAITAVAGAAWIAARDSRVARRREEQGQREAVARERRSLQAARTAALNLAVLAATQIHELRVLLRDETRRGRVTRVSPSRTLLTTEHMLTAFPIQSLGEAAAMVGFSFFPGALETAAEICANLETDVRAAAAGERHGVFSAYEMQMTQLDKSVQRHLVELKQILGADPTTSDPPGGSIPDISHPPQLAIVATQENADIHQLPGQPVAAKCAV